MKQKGRTPFLKWASLVLFASFSLMILIESALPGAISSKQSTFVASFFSDIINLTGSGDVKEIYPTEIKFDDDAPDEIIRGTTGKFTVTLLGTETTNRTNVTFESDHPDRVHIVQKGLTAWVEAIGKVSDDKITLTATAEQKKGVDPLKIEKTFTICPRKKPEQFTAELKEEDRTIKAGCTKTIDIKITGDPSLDEKANAQLKYGRKYDVTLLAFASTDEDVATVDKYGVIHAKKKGSATISIEGGVYSFPITVTSGAGVKVPEKGSLVCQEKITRYVYDLDHDDDEHVYHTNVGASFESGTEPTDASIRYEIEGDDIVARVDQKGNVFGLKRETAQDEIVKIWAISNMDNEVKDCCEVIVRHADIKSLSIKEEEKERKIEVSDQITITPVIEPLNAFNQRLACSSNAEHEHIVEARSAGNCIVVTGKGVGTTSIDIWPEGKETIRCSVTITVDPKPIIGQSEFADFESFIRKSAGHFFLFFTTAIFAFLTFYLFLRKRPLWFNYVMSLIAGVILASLSEFIQFLTPQRKGSFIDVLIDASGFIIASTLIFVILIIVWHVKRKKRSREPEVKKTVSVADEEALKK